MDSLFTCPDWLVRRLAISVPPALRRTGKHLFLRKSLSVISAGHERITGRPRGRWKDYFLLFFYLPNGIVILMLMSGTRAGRSLLRHCCR
jgi:hypothetical protein